MNKHNIRRWTIIGLLALLAACAGPGKPTVKLSATPTALEDGQTLILKAEATGGQGSLRVEFYLVQSTGGTEKVGEDVSAPFELDLPITANDDTTLAFTAKAIAADSQFSISEPVSVGVKVDKEAPKVSVVASSSQLNAAGSVTLTANASDNKGVVKVEFFKGATKLGEDTTPADGFSLSLNLSAADNGSLKYSAKAYDKKGNVGASAEVTVSVDIDATLPAVFLSSDRTTLYQAGAITLSATASDDKGVARVEFYQGDTLLTSKHQTDPPSSTFTHSLGFTDANNGLHSYTAKVYDGNGNTGISEPVYVTVDIDATNPTVSLSANPTSLSAPGILTLTATASDNKSISKVEFYKGNELLGNGNLGEAGYTKTVEYSTSYKATDTFSAKAFDPSGNTASTTVGVAIDIDLTPPQVSLESSSTDVTAKGSITLSATASDANDIVKVEFYEGTTKLGEDTSSPYQHSIEYAYLSNGNHSYTAKAFDSRGNSTQSGAVDVSVNIPAPGGLDTSFGTGGKVDAGFSSINKFMYGSALQSDGKILMGMSYDNPNGGYSHVLVRYNSNGSLDSSFGSNGISSNDGASWFAVQSDVKLVLVGSSSNGSNYDFVLFRYDSNGLLDNSFGSNGKVTTDFGANESVSFVAVQSDGMIVVAGGSYKDGESDFALARYDPNGLLDTTFGTGGKVITDFGANDHAAFVAVQSDGKIVLYGEKYTWPNSFNMALARYDSDGSLDDSFGTGGKLIIDVEVGETHPLSIAIQSDNKFLLMWQNNGGEPALARYHSDGLLDSSFGSNGIVTIDFGSAYDSPSSMVVQSDGKIVVAGSRYNGNDGEFALARYNSDGSLETSFGSNGIAATDFGSSYDGVTSLILQPDGKIVALGSGYGGFALARYNP